MRGHDAELHAISLGDHRKAAFEALADFDGARIAKEHDVAAAALNEVLRRERAAAEVVGPHQAVRLPRDVRAPDHERAVQRRHTVQHGGLVRLADHDDPV